MRKIFSFVLALLIVFPQQLTANAVSISKSSTRPINVFSFLELATYRMTICAKILGMDVKECINPFSGFACLSTESGSLVITSYGSLIFSEDEKNVNSATIYTSGPKLDPESVLQSICVFVSAFSALEYDITMDDTFELQYKIGLSKSQNAAEESIRIYLDEIVPKIDELKNNKFFNQFKTLVYSGNYDYYVEFKDVDGILAPNIIAEKR